MWFSSGAALLFDNSQLAVTFILNVFDLLLKVANDSVSRSWSITNKTQKQADMDWLNRQRAMFLLGLDQNGEVMGMNVVGRDDVALKAMFHPTVVPILQHQNIKV